MKFHRPVFEAIASGLQEIFAENKYADKVIERLLKSNPKWGARDRSEIAETVYSCVRWWRRLWFIYDVDPPVTKPAYLMSIALLWHYLQGEKLPDWVECAHFNYDKIELRNKKAQNFRKIKESVPDWLDEWGEKSYGSDWEPILAALNKPSQLCIRANTLVTNVKEVQKRLLENDIESELIPGLEDGIVIKNWRNVFSSEMFKKGFFELQDAGSQMIVPFLQVEPGMRVIDACAGAGGKSLQLAAMMKNKGLITSMDTDGRKLEELKKRAKRNQAFNIQTKVIEGSKSWKRLEATCDRLLLDVPCSGMGTLRRNPDAKWKLSPDFIQRVIELQRSILENYSRMVRKGGKLVYATCSILPEENEMQVKLFLEKFGNEFELEDEKWLRPDRDGYDGFYMARLRRK